MMQVVWYALCQPIAGLLLLVIDAVAHGAVSNGRAWSGWCNRVVHGCDRHIDRVAVAVLLPSLNV
jgi:hypothetical protein